MSSVYDAIVIGTGAGGGTLALHLDNLYVVDASCFVSASAVNPSLTIIANAIRIADHLIATRLH